MSLLASFALIALCGVVFLCAVIVRQTGDPVNRYGIFAGAAVLLLQAAVITLGLPPDGGWIYAHPAELVLVITLAAVLAALSLRILRYRWIGQIIDPVADANNQLPGLLNSLPVQAAFVTPDLRYGFVNDAYCAAAGLSRSNIIGRNQDDHVKNIAFLMDKAGHWSLSPAFDMTYSFQPTGKWTSVHQLILNGKRDGFDLEAATLKDLKEYGQVPATHSEAGAR